MKIVAETSISQEIIPALNAVAQTWGFDTGNVKWVNDITQEPYQQIDFEKDGTHWRLIFPAYGGMTFIIDYAKHQDKIKTYAGGAVGNGNRQLDDMDRASIVVYGNETPWELELRVVHEFLHASDMDADGLLRYAPKFLTFWDLLGFRWHQLWGQYPESTPYYQCKFYHWLLDQREKRLM